MQVPLQIAFRNVERREPQLEAEIRERAAKLEQFCDRITSCLVTVEVPHRHQRQGGLYEVRIHLALPAGHDVVVHGGRDADPAHEDPRVAVRDAFRAARRQLQDVMRQMQGAVKTHQSVETPQPELNTEEIET